MKPKAANQQGVRDAATLLPVTAAILLLPPFILGFAVPVLVAGIPLIVAYNFGAWIVIVFCAWLLAHNLAKEDIMAGAEGQAEERSSPDGR